ncbi:hypothetical protein KEM52_001313 [Ascosphaera acerosa]|nr:hypothetical protein KEM52_001313 [Ascosphaera acerosa]
MVSQPRPQIRIREDGLQLSYVLPHRVYDVKAYPRRSPNGSSIVLYAHDSGVRVVWRGGRTFRPRAELARQQAASQRQQQQQQQQRQQTQQRRDADAVMIIDSSDEEEDGAATVPTPQSSFASASGPNSSAGTGTGDGDGDGSGSYTPPAFSTHTAEIDPAAPHEPVLRHIDVRTGCRVVKLAIPAYVPAPDDDDDSHGQARPPILSSMVVCAAICADATVRLLSVPLAPPMPDVTDPAGMGVQCLVLPGATVQDLPAGVAMTFTPHAGISDDDTDRSRQRSATRTSRSRSRPRSHDTRHSVGRSLAAGSDAAAWDALVAVHSMQFGGALTVYRVPAINDSPLPRFTSTGVTAVHKQYLFSGVRSIAFSPRAYPSRQHGRFLVAHADQVRIFEAVAPVSQPAFITERDEDAFVDQATWLATIHLPRAPAPSSQPPSQPPPQSAPREIVDVAWVLGGKGVMVLLTDGSWGVWCIEKSSVRPSLSVGFSQFACHGRLVAPITARPGTITITGASDDGLLDEEEAYMDDVSSPTKGLRPLRSGTRETRAGTSYHSGDTTVLSDIMEGDEDEEEEEGAARLDDGGLSGARTAAQRFMQPAFTGPYPTPDIASTRTGGIAVRTSPTGDEEVVLWHANNVFRIDSLLATRSSASASGIPALYIPASQSVLGAGSLPPASLQDDSSARTEEADLVLATDSHLSVLTAPASGLDEEYARPHGVEIDRGATPTRPAANADADAALDLEILNRAISERGTGYFDLAAYA